MKRAAQATATLLATWFGCGYAPKGPGTAGSAAALAIAWILHRYAGWPPLAFAWICVPLMLPAIWSADVVARNFSAGAPAGAPASGAGVHKNDPQIVVIDEVVGQWVALAGVTVFNWKSWIAAFVLFRLFDIFKPPPVRRFENLPGGLGIVADDVMAGVYAALVLYAAGWFNLY